MIDGGASQEAPPSSISGDVSYTRVGSGGPTLHGTSREQRGQLPSSHRRQASLEVAIVGLPQSGKTTVFNAATRGAADVAAYAGDGRPNLGVAKVSDERLARLSSIFGSKRTIPNEVKYLDLPAPAGTPSTGAGVSGERLTHLQQADVLAVVVRAFESPSVPAPPDGLDPARDAGAVVDELTLADLEILERRLARVEAGFKGAKAAERDILTKERSLIDSVKLKLEDGVAVRDQELSAEVEKALSGFSLLTAKPVIAVANAGEEIIDDMGALEERLALAVSGRRVHTAAICGQLEMELAQMDPEDESEFRASLGLAESGLDKMIDLTHQALDLVTFFTANASEARAWTAARGTTVLEAAGRIHSDFEKGFIRAETIDFEELSRCGTIAESRKRGLLRQEGRDYTVSDGDVVNILFNV